MKLGRKWTVAGCALLASATFVVVPAAPVHARPIEETFSITVAGGYGDRLFTRQNSWIAVNQSNQVQQQVLQVTVNQNNAPVMFFDFSSRAGSMRNLEIGYYGDAQRYPFMDPGRAGISISPLGFCSEQIGNFEVRDIELIGLAINKIWITFQRYCNGVPAFGEVRLGYADAAVEVSPRVQRWSSHYPGRTSYDANVTVRNPAGTPVDVTGVSVAGPHAADFPIRQNGCAGSLGTTGCLIRLGFVPGGPGPRHAVLRVTTTGGDVETAIDGWGLLGVSNWVVDVDWEDLSHPDEHLVLPYSASIGVPYEFQTQAYAEDGIVWNARFDLAGNATFAPGRYVYRPDGTQLLMSLARGNAACEIDRATIDVFDIVFSGPDSKLALLDMAMDVHCRANAGHTVKGRLKFHDRDDQTGPAGVTGLTATRAGDTVTLGWSNPEAPDLAGIIVRWYAGRIAPGATDVGQAVLFGTGTGTTFAAPGTSPIAVSVWAYDKSGNIGEHVVLVVEP